MATKQLALPGLAWLACRARYTCSVVAGLPNTLLSLPVSWLPCRRCWMAPWTPPCSTRPSAPRCAHGGIAWYAWPMLPCSWGCGAASCCAPAAQIVVNSGHTHAPPPWHHCRRRLRGCRASRWWTRWSRTKVGKVAGGMTEDEGGSPCQARACSSGQAPAANLPLAHMPLTPHTLSPPALFC